MKIYQVTESDTQIRFYWFSIKKEAHDHARAYRKAREGYAIGGVEVEEVEFEGGRRGMADALNFVISLTCFNEG